MTKRAPPPGKTSLGRMMMSAHDEAVRIEISEEVRVSGGWAAEFDAAAIARRDDFAGIVRLLEKIMADKTLLERLAS